MLLLGCGRIRYLRIGLDAAIDHQATDADSAFIQGSADSSADIAAAHEDAGDAIAIDAARLDALFLSDTTARDANLDALTDTSASLTSDAPDANPGCTSAPPGTIVSVRALAPDLYAEPSVLFPFDDTDALISFNCRCGVQQTFRAIGRDFVVAAGEGYVGRFARDGTQRWSRSAVGILRAVSEPNLNGDILVWYESGSRLIERWSKDDGRTVWTTPSPEIGGWSTSPPYYTVGRRGIYVGYDLSGTMTLGGVLHTSTSANRDALVVKYGFDGAHEWTRTWPTQSNYAPTIDGMASDAIGLRAFINFGAGSFDFGTGSVSRTASGYVVHLDEFGSVLDARGARGRLMTRLRDDGYITRDGNDLRRFSNFGNELWSLLLGGGNRFPSVCSEIANEIVCSVNLVDAGPVSLNGATITGPDLFVLGLDSLTGAVLWSTQLNIQGHVFGGGYVYPRSSDECGRVSAYAEIRNPYAPMGTLLVLPDGGLPHRVEIIIQP